MKYLNYIILIAVIVFGFISYPIVIENNTTKRYCGKVIKCYIQNASVEYSSHSEKHLIFYNDSLHRNIDVVVNNQIFANKFIGDNVCFELTKNELNR